MKLGLVLIFSSLAALGPYFGALAEEGITSATNNVENRLFVSEKGYSLRVEKKTFTNREGALYWRGPKKVEIKLGRLPYMAYGHPNGAVVVYGKKDSSGDHRFVIASWQVPAKVSEKAKEDIIHTGGSFRELVNNKIVIMLDNEKAVIYKGVENETILIGKNYAKNGDEAALKKVIDEVSRVNLNEKDRANMRSYGTFFTELKANRQVPPYYVAKKRFSDIVDVFLGNLSGLLMISGAGYNMDDYIYQLGELITGGEIEQLKGWDLFFLQSLGLSDDGYQDKAKGKMMELISAAKLKKVIIVIQRMDLLVGMGKGKSTSHSDVMGFLSTQVANKNIVVIGTVISAREASALILQRPDVVDNFHTMRIDKDFKKRQIKEVIEQKAKDLGLTFDNKQWANTMIDAVKSEVGGQDAGHPKREFAILKQLASKNSGPVDRDLVKEAIETLIPKPRFLKKGRVFGSEGQESLRDYLTRIVPGQRSAIDRVASNFEKAILMGRKKKKPVGVFTAIGTSSTFKSELANEFAAFFDLKPFTRSFENARDITYVNSLLGSSDGYIGSGVPGKLVQWIWDNPTGVIIIDEWHAAHPLLYTALNTLIHEGMITDRSNNTAFFNRGVIFITANLGIDAIKKFSFLQGQQRYTNLQDWIHHSRDAIDRNDGKKFEELLQITSNSELEANMWGPWDQKSYREVFLQREDRLIDIIQKSLVRGWPRRSAVFAADQNPMAPWVVNRLPMHNWLICYPLGRSEAKKVTDERFTKIIDDMKKNDWPFKLEFPDRKKLQEELKVSGDFQSVEEYMSELLLDKDLGARRFSQMIPMLTYRAIDDLLVDIENEQVPKEELKDEVVYVYMQASSDPSGVGEYVPTFKQKSSP